MLPSSGEYQIIVGGTRGNASFDLPSRFRRRIVNPPIAPNLRSWPLILELAPTLSDAVVRGDRKTYLLGAQNGQQMDVSIAFLEGNAVYDLIAPNGVVLRREQTQESLTLASSGDYQVVVWHAWQCHL